MDLIRLAYGIAVRSQNDAERSVTFVCSTDAVDSFGEIVMQDWDLSRYKANPIVLFGHNARELPVGYASAVGVEDGKLVATLTFVDEKANPFAEQVYQCIRQGALRAVSVGFRPGRVDRVERDGVEVMMLSGNVLAEISVVPMGANPEAVALERAATVTHLRSLAEHITVNVTNEEPSAMSLLTTLAALFGLATSATEKDVVDAATQARDAQSRERELLTVTGKTSVPEAFGVVRAWQHTATEHEKTLAEVATLRANEAEVTRAAVIAKGKAEHRITPAIEATLQKKDAGGRYLMGNEQLSAFVDALPAIPALAGATSTATKQPEEGNAVTAVSVPDGHAKWEDLSPAAKHDLFVENKPLYEALNADWKQRGRPKASPATKATKAA